MYCVLCIVYCVLCIVYSVYSMCDSICDSMWSSKVGVLICDWYVMNIVCNVIYNIKLI